MPDPKGSNIDPKGSNTQQSSDREAQIQRMMRQIEQKLREGLADEAGTLDEIESETQEIGEQIKQIIEQERLESKGTGFVGNRRLCPQCGTIQRYRGKAQRKIVTLAGERLIKRAYYYCDACRKGCYPLDASLGATAGAFSIAVWALATRFSGYVPFAHAARELEEVCGIHISASSMQRISRKSGRQLQKDWEAAEQALRRCEDMSDPPLELLRLRGGTAQKPISQLQSSMDGVYLFIAGEWKEVKMAVSFSQNNQGMIANYYASTLESRDFGPRAWLLHQMSGGHRCQKCAVIGDGAPWIWKEYGKYMPQATQILDFYHVSEYLGKIARLRFGEKTVTAKTKGRAWVLRQEKHLQANNVSAVVRSVRDWRPATLEGQELQRTQLAYYGEHRKRMQYDDYYKAGWHIGSGMVESANNHVLQNRMKRPGMRWSAEGAASMIHLRATVCSDDRPSYRSIAERAMAAA